MSYAIKIGFYFLPYINATALICYAHTGKIYHFKAAMHIIKVFALLKKTIPLPSMSSFVLSHLCNGQAPTTQANLTSAQSKLARQDYGCKLSLLRGAGGE